MGFDILLPTKYTWKIIDATNKDIVNFTSIIELDIKNDNKASEYPMEQGTFSSYNKNNSPVVIDMVATIEGALYSIQPLIDRLESLSRGTELLSIVTPVKEYRKFNLVNCSYAHKRENGISSVTFNLSFKEIKETVAEYINSNVIKVSSAKNSSSITNEKTGKKQAMLVKILNWVKG